MRLQDNDAEKNVNGQQTYLRFVDKNQAMIGYVGFQTNGQSLGLVNSNTTGVDANVLLGTVGGVLQLEKNGNVFITSSGHLPTAKLDVDGDARVRTLATGTTTDNVVTADANGLLNKLDLTTVSRYAEPWYGTGSGTTAVGIGENIYHTGRVLVGTDTDEVTTVSTPLAVYSQGQSLQLTLGRSESGYTQMGADNTGLLIWPAGYENGLKFRISPNGDVIIGRPTSAPTAAKLEVKGYIKVASSDATADANPQVGMIR